MIMNVDCPESRRGWASYPFITLIKLIKAVYFQNRIYLTASNFKTIHFHCYIQDRPFFHLSPIFEI